MAKLKPIEYFKFDKKLIPSPWSEVKQCIRCGSELEGKGCENPSCPENPTCPQHPPKQLLSTARTA